MKVKRIFDLFAGIVLVGVLAGPICFIALCVRLTSRGPILHWSKRKGINNVDFMMPKFRSMIVNAPIVSSEGMTNQESYFTPIGRFLRKYSLDEFPQLFSVLKGNMSFVGPRPALYSQENLILFRREAGVDQILPGVTGWAQVNGRNLMTVEDKVCYDLDYMKRQSILFDLKILYKTIFKPIKAGAYEYSDFTCWPAYTLEEANAVRDVVLSNKTNAFIGKKNKEFEQNFSLFCGIKYAATTTSGSTALELALKSLGVETGDEVIVTPRSFIASASCVANVGAIPIFVDVDSDSGNITASTISSAISSRTKAVICVHLGGCPCDMDDIMTLARDHDLFVIEDCAQAMGARYKERSVGAIGDIGVWSFCNDKILSTGEGGMLTTNDKTLIEKINAYKNHGRKNKDIENAKEEYGFKWTSSSFGTNLRMTEMQAAIGIIQLRKIHVRNIIRVKYAEIIYQAFEKNPTVFRIIRPTEFDKNAWYRIYAYIIPEGLKDGWSRKMIIENLKMHGLNVDTGVCPEIYLENSFVDSEFSMDKRLPVAKELGETSLAISINSNIPLEKIKEFASIIIKVANDASK